MKIPMTKYRYAQHLRGLQRMFDHMQQKSLTITRTEHLMDKNDVNNAAVVVSLSNGERWTIGTGKLTVEQVE